MSCVDASVFFVVDIICFYNITNAFDECLCN